MKLVIDFKNIEDLGGQMIELLKGLQVVTEISSESDAAPAGNGAVANPPPAMPRSRKDLKDELDRRGIEYNTRLSTPKLAILLDEAANEAPFVESGDGSDEAVGPTPAPEPDTTVAPALEDKAEKSEEEDIFGVEAASKDEGIVYTRVAVRDALVDYIATKKEGGQDAARKVLVDVAGVNRLADLPEDRFGDVMKALGK